MYYDVDPTTLTGQGIREMSVPKPVSENGAPETFFMPPQMSGTQPLLSEAATPISTQVNSTLPHSQGFIQPELLDLAAPITDPETLDLIMSDIERFLTGDQPQ